MLFHTGTDSKIGLTHLGLQVFKATIIIRFSLPKVCPSVPPFVFHVLFKIFLYCFEHKSFWEFFWWWFPLFAIQWLISWHSSDVFWKKKGFQKTKLTLCLSSVNWFSYWSKTAYIWCEKWSKSEWIDEWNIYAQIDRDVTTCGVSRYHAWGIKQCGKYSRLPVLTVQRSTRFLCID